MAKIANPVDIPMMPSNGKWVWKEETLEYVSNNPADKHDKRKDRRQQKGAVHFPDHRGRSSPSQMGRGPFGVGRGKMGLRGLPGQRAVSGKQSTHTHVTIGDIKSVACDMTGQNFAETFSGLYETEQFDHFLLCLLNYFHWYFEKKAHEEKPNPMNNEPSRREREYYADLCSKLEVAHKVLGQAYCILILGIGIDEHHHMACGRSRVSNTYKDRSMYETLYTFCTFVVWVAFRRQKDYEVVKKELNRTLRSETFNPAIRIKNAPEPENKESANGEDAAEEEKKPKREDKKLTPAEYRRQQGRRPPIKSIINQRSPALVSILPSPKEEASWLFKSQGKDAMTEKFKLPNWKELLSETNRTDIADEDDSKYAHLHPDTSKLKVGIIGEPLNLFNPLTLTPKGAENEEGEEEDGNKDDRRGSVAPKTAGSQERRMSRDATGVSQVTHEGLPDDD